MRDLRKLDITKLTPDEAGEIQQFLISQGYDLGPTGADKIFGRRSKAALADYNSKYKENPLEELWSRMADLGQFIKTANEDYGTRDVPVLLSRHEMGTLGPGTVKKSKLVEEDVPTLSFDEYMYRSGSSGFLRRLGNLTSVTKNLINGFFNPDGNNASLSEGARRQMVSAAYHNKKGNITDSDHAALSGLKGNQHSGEEFRQQSSFWDYLSQMMDAPYHNIFGQSTKALNKETGTVSPNQDSYSFNNQWRGNKVTKVFKDGEGTGSILDVWEEFKNAKKSGASTKAAIESAASVRGVNVKHDNSSSVVRKEDIDKYTEEYKKYVNSSPEERWRINQQLGVSN